MSSENTQKHRGETALFITAIIWGSGFVAVDYALAYGFTPALVNVIRFFWAAVVLLLFLRGKLRQIRRDDLKAGAVAGSFFFFGFYLQTTGLQYTTVSANALLTATNLLMVPFIVWLVFKRKPPLRVFVTVALCFIGVMILSWEPGGGFRFGLGEILTLLCAVCYACHISYLDYKSAGRDTLIFTFIQIVTVLALSLVAFAATETASLPQVQWARGFWPLLYLGIFPTALCLFLQTLGQKYTPAGPAAIILSLESLFGSIFSVALGLEPLTASLLIGGSVIMASVFLVQWKNAAAPLPGPVNEE